MDSGLTAASSTTPSASLSPASSPCFSFATTPRLDTLPPELLLAVAAHLEARFVLSRLSRVCRKFSHLFYHRQFSAGYWRLRVNRQLGASSAAPHPAGVSTGDTDHYSSDSDEDGGAQEDSRRRVSPPAAAPDWRHLCVELEEYCLRWADPTTHHRLELRCGITGSVDAVHLMQAGRLLITGSRDNNINVVKIDAEQEEAKGQQQVEERASLPALSGNSGYRDLIAVAPPPASQVSTDTFTSNCSSAVRALKASVVKAYAHGGWVWSLTSSDNILCSAGWDGRVKLWDINSLTPASEPVTVLQSNSRAAMLCARFTHSPNQPPSQLILAGSYDKHLYVFDRRLSNPTVARLRLHTKPVLCCDVDDDDSSSFSSLWVTASEDGTVVLSDCRKLSSSSSTSFSTSPTKATTNNVPSCVVQTIKMEGFPMAVSFGHRQLWIGDKLGRLHLFQPDAQAGQMWTRSPEKPPVQLYGESVSSGDGVDGGQGDNPLGASPGGGVIGGGGKITGIQHSLGSLVTCGYRHWAAPDPHKGCILVHKPAHPAPVIRTLLPGRGDITGIDYRNGVLAAGCSANCATVWVPSATISTR